MNNVPSDAPVMLMQSVQPCDFVMQSNRTISGLKEGDGGPNN